MEPCKILTIDDSTELPDGSGCGFCQEVRSHSDIPVLLSGGLARREYIAQGYGAGGAIAW